MRKRKVSLMNLHSLQKMKRFLLHGKQIKIGDPLIRVSKGVRTILITIEMIETRNTKVRTQMLLIALVMS